VLETGQRVLKIQGTRLPQPAAFLLTTNSRAIQVNSHAAFRTHKVVYINSQQVCVTHNTLSAGSSIRRDTVGGKVEGVLAG